MRLKAAKTVDDYIGRHPEDVQRLLRSMRSAVSKGAPDAEETISYGLPALRGSKMLVWYGAHAHHIGFYPGASGVAKFEKDLGRFKVSKGTVRFPFDEPLPLALVTRIVEFRAREQTSRRKKKSP